MSCFYVAAAESIHDSDSSVVPSYPGNEIATERQEFEKYAEARDPPDTQMHGESSKHKHRRIASGYEGSASPPPFHDLGSSAGSEMEPIYELGNIGTLLQSFIKEVGGSVRHFLGSIRCSKTWCTRMPSAAQYVSRMLGSPMPSSFRRAALPAPSHGVCM